MSERTIAASKPKLNLTRSAEMYEEAKRLSPGGMMGIRRPYNFVVGEYPIFIERGYAGHIVDVDGNDYIDMLCAYGPIILGYDEAEINDAVKAQMDKGFCFSLVQPIQNELQQRLINLVPSAEMVILVKTGSDATGVAVRVARGYTDRNVILRCGYHGWHDWAVESPRGRAQGRPGSHRGVRVRQPGRPRGQDPGSTRTTWRASSSRPVGHPLAKPVDARLPPGYLEGSARAGRQARRRPHLRRDPHGLPRGHGRSAAALRRDARHLSTFGKALANGYPISAVVGKEKFMKVCESKVFISSTFFPNSLEMAAAMKCLDILERDHVLDQIWTKGEKFLADLQEVITATKAPAKVSGIPPMPYLTFEKVDQHYKARREMFYTETIRRGLFIQPYHHWYICGRHTDADLAHAISAIREVPRDRDGEVTPSPSSHEQEDRHSGQGSS